MSAASGKLGISPAMVGQHVAALEERLGTRLLNRTTRRQSLTDFGKSYLEQCRDILERVAIADQDAEASQTKPRGLLKVTAPTTFGAEVLMPALPRYREIAPEVMLDITLTDRNVDIVDEGFDIAIRRPARQPPHRAPAGSLSNDDLRVTGLPRSTWKSCPSKRAFRPRDRRLYAGSTLAVEAFERHGGGRGRAQTADQRQQRPGRAHGRSCRFGYRYAASHPAGFGYPGRPSCPALPRLASA